MQQLQMLLDSDTIALPLKTIVQKVQQGIRISVKDGLYLFTDVSIDTLGVLANYIREKKHGNKTFYNKNFHIEPTNVCVFSCAFCSYSQLYKNREDGWELSIEDMVNLVKKYDGQSVTEVHIVGGVHPKLDLKFFSELLTAIKAHRPELHIKAFTAVEFNYMFRKAKVSTEEGLKILQAAGLQSIPGGGAEIFSPEIRTKICADKVDGDGWLNIHQTAHRLGMHSNATMLYGHIEKYEHRIDHLNRLRMAQDETGGFNCFIPLKFRNKDNDMSYIDESSIIEDIKVYAVSRIFLDNFAHLKAYWPMLGRQQAQLMMSFGVNDLDGTIDDSTKIYSMAGSSETNPNMSTKDICELISHVGRLPVERDTLYNEIG
jgi:aminodeoxyfutalosine synthase